MISAPSSSLDAMLLPYFQFANPNLPNASIDLPIAYAVLYLHPSTPVQNFRRQWHIPTRKTGTRWHSSTGSSPTQKKSPFLTNTTVYSTRTLTQTPNGTLGSNRSRGDMKIILNKIHVSIVEQERKQAKQPELHRRACMARTPRNLLDT